MSGLIFCRPYIAGIIYGGYGLTAGSNNSGGSDRNVWKYGFLDNVVTNGSALAIAHGVNGSAFGNLESGVFCGGFTLAGAYLQSCDRYVYASNTTVTGINMGDKRSNGIGVGGGLYGIAITGFNGSTFLASCSKYNFTINTMSSGVALGSSSYNGYGLNTYSYGLLAISGGPSTIKYTYASDARVASGSLGIGRTKPGVVGTMEIGYAFFGGNQERTEYTFATDVAVNVTSLGTSRPACVGMGNGGVGVIAGGTIGSAMTDMVEVFTYASGDIVTGTNLLMADQSQMGVSTNPGHL